MVLGPPPMLHHPAEACIARTFELVDTCPADTTTASSRRRDRARALAATSAPAGGVEPYALALWKSLGPGTYAAQNICR